MKTYGLELEFFVKDAAGAYTLCPALAMDACGWLAEARGQEHANPLDAKHLLNSAIEKLSQQAAKLALKLELADTAELPKELMRVARRKYGKGPSHSFYMSGRCYTSDKPRAGLHVHFGNRIETQVGDKPFTYVGLMNLPRIIYLMDQAFKEEIKAAKRVPGEYELKPHGFEYRSLPATANLDKVVETLEKLRSEF